MRLLSWAICFLEKSFSEFSRPSSNWEKAELTWIKMFHKQPRWGSTSEFHQICVPARDTCEEQFHSMISTILDHLGGVVEQPFLSCSLLVRTHCLNFEVLPCFITATCIKVFLTVSRIVDISSFSHFSTFDESESTLVWQLSLLGPHRGRPWRMQLLLRLWQSLQRLTG